jgi:hypothetical protein
MEHDIHGHMVLERYHLVPINYHYYRQDYRFLERRSYQGRDILELDIVKLGISTQSSSPIENNVLFDL